MAKQTLNILTIEGNLSPVKAIKIVESLGIKAFIWKDTRKNGYSFYQVNEFYTGMALFQSSLKLGEVIDEFMKKARNAAYWENEAEREVYNRETVQYNLKGYGYANQD